MRHRTILAVVLIVLAGVTAAAGLVAAYARTEVLSGPSFSQRAAASVQRPAVRDAVAQAITREVIERARPDVIAARPLIESVVSGVVGSSSFRPLVARAARELYDVTAGGGGSQVVLGLSDAAVIAIEALRRVQPELAAQIPPGAEDAAADLGDHGVATDLVDRAEAVRRSGIVLPLLALLFIACAVAVAPARRRVAGWAGLALAAAGLLVGAALPLARWIVVSRTGGGDVAGAVYDAFFDDLGRWALTLVGVGAVVWIGALGRLSGDALTRRARAVVAWATAPPSPGGATAVRGVVLVVAALVVGFGWRALLPIVAVAVAASIGMQGLVLLFGALGPRAAAVPAGHHHRAHRTWPSATAVAAVLTVVVAGAASLAVALGGDAAYGPSEVTRCNGHAALCDRPINEVAFAATHNSMSAAAERDWFRAEQTGGIARQLRFGVRGLLIDTWYGAPGAPGARGVSTDFARSGFDREALVREFGAETVAAIERLRGRFGFATPASDTSQVYLCHVGCEAGATLFADALSDIRDFLQRNPGEVLVLVLQDQVTPEDTRREFLRAGLGDFLLLPPAAGDAWPTLGEMIASGERMLVMTEHTTSPDIPWLVQAFDVMEETPYEFASPADMSCVPNRGGTGKPFFQMNNWIEQIVPSPTTAATVNARGFLLDRARRCQRERDHIPNLIAVDFYEEGDVLGVVDALNGFTPPPR